MTERLYRERRTYVFTCQDCSRKAHSYRRSRAKKQRCRQCRKTAGNENQLRLFGTTDGTLTQATGTSPDA